VCVNINNFFPFLFSSNLLVRNKRKIKIWTLDNYNVFVNRTMFTELFIYFPFIIGLIKMISLVLINFYLCQWHNIYRTIYNIYFCISWNLYNPTNWAKSASTPSEPSLKLHNDSSLPYEDISLYRRLVGRFLYLNTIRLNITFITQQLRQFLTAYTYPNSL